MIKIIGNLILPKGFELLESRTGPFQTGMGGGIALRLYCKPLSIDSTVLLFMEELPGDESYRELTESIEGYKILQRLSRRKVILQARRRFEVDPRLHRPGKVLLSPFRWNGLPGVLVLTESNVSDIRRILNIKDSQLPLSVESLEEIDKITYQRLAVPPENLGQILLSLPDVTLQLLLNRILHKNIASIDMLATFIFELGDQGERLLDNLSSRVKQEVAEKAKGARFTKTYRWAEEVKYIIGRNIFAAAKELSVGLPGLSSSEALRGRYEAMSIKAALEKKSVAEWLSEFSQSGQLRELMNEMRRPVFTKALTGIPETELRRHFQPYLSGDGLQMLSEDVESAARLPDDERTRARIQFFRKVKDMVYSPLLGSMDFDMEAARLVNNSGDIDLITDEVGYAQTVYALKQSPPEWTEKVLQGVMRNIYEDVLKNKIQIKRYGDYRIPECRRNFLKTALILHDEEKI